MKQSQLINIIKEEIHRVLNENTYETLPGYSSLPELRKDIDFKNRKSIVLPSINNSISSDELLSKEDVKNWVEKFETQFETSPQFKVEGTGIKVLNMSRSMPSAKDMKDFGRLD
jgi:hypothetical protein